MQDRAGGGVERESCEKRKQVLSPSLLPSGQQPNYLDIVSCVQGRGEAEHGGQKHLEKSKLQRGWRWPPAEARRDSV